MADAPTPAVQDYLKAIYEVADGAGQASPAEIADLMRVRASSVTGMLKRLAEMKLIEYESGRGASLTADGRAEAMRVIRRHRLVELFLTRVLKLDWSEVDVEAERLEHAISPKLEAAIARYLGEPVEDPHGHPIPDADGRMPDRRLVRLTELPAGAHALIREANDEDSERLRHWASLGLVPGVEILMVGYRPLDGVFELVAGGRTLRLGREGLSGLRVEANAR